MSDLNATYASHRGREEDGHTDIIGSKKAREMKKVSRQRRPSEITSELLEASCISNRDGFTVSQRHNPKKRVTRVECEVFGRRVNVQADSMRNPHSPLAGACGISSPTSIGPAVLENTLHSTCSLCANRHRRAPRRRGAPARTTTESHTSKTQRRLRSERARMPRCASAARQSTSRHGTVFDTDDAVRARLRDRLADSERSDDDGVSE